MEMIQYKTTLSADDSTEVLVTLYPELQEAIDNEWESLYFADNVTVFAKVEIGKFITLLETDGRVRIRHNDTLLTNINSEEIRALINAGGLCSDNCYIEDNNWFCMLYYEQIVNTEQEEEHLCLDDEVFESTPENIEDFKDRLMDMVRSFYYEYKETESEIN